MISGSDDHTIRVWDLRNGKDVQIKTEPVGAINDLRFHPTEMVFAGASQVNNTQLFQPHLFYCHAPTRCLFLKTNFFLFLN